MSVDASDLLLAFIIPPISGTAGEGVAPHLRRAYGSALLCAWSPREVVVPLQQSGVQQLREFKPALVASQSKPPSLQAGARSLHPGVQGLPAYANLRLRTSP